MQQHKAFLDQFLIRRLIFVNSAAYAYTEIRLDQHTALFGRNNLGKTSMLNALKLFLLPEENFRRCERKFGFKGANGKEYGTAESFAYYFPEERSFIVLEAENVHGAFCLVLHQGKREFSYARMAVPGAYDYLRPGFWNFDSAENEGLGGPVAHLNLPDLLASLRQQGGIDLHDVKTIKERLFTERPLDPDLGRFCLLPLKQGGTQREIDAWRQLIHLAFDISSREESTLPNAIATIMEGEKQRDAEQVSVDFAGILQAYHDLRAEGDRLQSLKNHRPLWNSFDSNYQRYLEESRFTSQDFLSLQAALRERGSTLEKEASQTSRARDEKQRVYQANQEQIRQLQDQLQTLAGQRQSEEKLVVRLQTSLDRVARIAADFPDYLNNDQLLEALAARRDELCVSCEGLRTRESREQRMTDLTVEINELQAQSARLKALLDQQQGALLAQLSPHGASVLQALNPEFATLQVNLNDSQREAIETFTALFGKRPEDSSDSRSGEFLGQALKQLVIVAYDAYNQRERWEEQLNALDIRLRKARQERNELDQLGRQPGDSLQKRLAEVEAQLSETGRDIEAVKGYGIVDQQFRECQAALEATREKQHHQREALETLQAAEERLHQDWKRAETRQQELDQQRSSVRRQSESLDSLRETHAPILSHWMSQLQAQPLAYQDGLADRLRDRLQSLRENGEALREQMSALLSAGLLENKADAAYRMLSLGELKTLRADFETAFAQLEAADFHHRERVSAHNKETAIKMDELRGAARQIRTFVQEINQEFKAYAVSNLAEVQVCLSLHPRFDQLLQELEPIDLRTDELADPQLYERLNDFCEEFFVQGSGRGPTLSMEQIIRRVSYRYRLEGHSHFDDKEQSNGTTSMVNSLLLSILIKRLLRQDARISLPLVMDEMASLDRDNLQTAAQIAQHHGFFLFGASPDMSSEIIMAVNHYVNLGAFQATTASYSPDRRVIYHGQCERLFSESLGEEADAGTTAFHEEGAVSRPAPQFELVSPD